MTDEELMEDVWRHHWGLTRERALLAEVKRLREENSSTLLAVAKATASISRGVEAAAEQRIRAAERERCAKAVEAAFGCDEEGPHPAADVIRAMKDDP